MDNLAWPAAVRRPAASASSLRTICWRRDWVFLTLVHSLDEGIKMMDRMLSIVSVAAVASIALLLPVDGLSQGSAKECAVKAKALFWNQDCPDIVATRPNVDSQPKVAAAKPAKVLGLRVAVRLVEESGGVKEVPPSYRFRTGDRVKLAFSSNKDGYFYLATIGSSGTVRILVPNSGRSTVIRSGLTYEFPTAANSYLKFQGSTGKEEIYAFLSESPLDEIEFDNGRTVVVGPDARPIPADSSRKIQEANEAPRMVASADDVKSRDLVEVAEDGVALYAAIKPASYSVQKRPISLKLTLTHVPNN